VARFEKEFEKEEVVNLATVGENRVGVQFRMKMGTLGTPLSHVAPRYRNRPNVLGGPRVWDIRNSGGNIPEGCLRMAQQFIAGKGRVRWVESRRDG
jgi:hypothetical protein